MTRTFPGFLQPCLMGIAHSETILIGHQLYSDLDELKAMGTEWNQRHMW